MYWTWGGLVGGWVGRTVEELAFLRSVVVVVVVMVGMSSSSSSPSSTEAGG